MFSTILTIHSYCRWFVLIGLVYIIIQSYFNFKSNKSYSKAHQIINRISLGILIVQISLGIWLYAISPFVSAFMQNPSDGLKMREVRFFAMEHSLMMLVSVIIISIGFIKSNRCNDSYQKHKIIFKWCLVGLIIILLNIPWEFSPLVNRPSFR